MRKADELTTFVCRFCVDVSLGRFIEDALMYLEDGCSTALSNPVEHLKKYNCDASSKPTILQPSSLKFVTVSTH